MTSTVRLLTGLAIAAGLAGCSSVKLPKADLMKFGEYHEDAKGVKTYPKITEAPEAPTDLRSDAAWDHAARKLLQTRDGFETPSDLAPARTQAEIERDFQAARARVQEYKKDDPQ